MLFFILYDDECVIDLIGVLEFKDILKWMLVLGGGIIGLEMVMVYDVFGMDVIIVELMD